MTPGTPRLTGKFSKSSAFISMRFHTLETEITLASASSALFKRDKKIMLVSNWHNFTGRRNDTLELLDKKYAAVPNVIKIRIPTIQPLSEGRVALKFFEHTEYLYDGFTPRWLEHPAHGHKVDVAALPLALPTEVAARVSTIDEDDQDNIRVEVGMDCFIVGFPLGISGPQNLPIWKRASIATEPDFDIDKLPKILVDTATREGLSGSPAHIVFNGYVTNHGLIGFGGADTTMGQHQRFLGIYSGRVGADQLGAQLGIVWKAEAIREILEGGVPGKPLTSSENPS